jgi:hypothetical protein
MGTQEEPTEARRPADVYAAYWLQQDLDAGRLDPDNLVAIAKRRQELHDDFVAGGGPAFTLNPDTFAQCYSCLADEQSQS